MTLEIEGAGFALLRSVLDRESVGVGLFAADEGGGSRLLYSNERFRELTSPDGDGDDAVRRVTREVSRMEMDGGLVVLEVVTDAARAAPVETGALLASLLKGLTAAASSSLDAREVSERILAIARDLLGVELGAVHVLDAPGGPARMVAALGYDVDGSEPKPLDETTLSGRAMAGGRLELFETGDDPRETDRRIDQTRLGEHRWAALPVFSKDELIGAVSLGFPGPRPFTYEEIDLYRAVANSLGAGLEKARLFDAERAARRDMQEQLETTRALLEAADAMVAWTNLNDLANGLAAILLRSTGHRRSVVDLWDEERREIVVLASLGDKAFPEGGRWPIDKVSEAARQAILQRNTRVWDFAQMPQADRGIAEREFSLTHGLYVPLVQRDRVVGMLVLDDPGERRLFTQREVDIVEGIAAQAAVAIENTRLLSAERDQALTAGTIADLSATLASASDLDAALPDALKSAGERLGAVGVALVLQDGDELVMRHAWGKHEPLIGRRYTPEQLPSHVRVLLSAEPAFVNDVDDGVTPVNVSMAREVGYRSFAIYPLVFRGSAAGTLSFAFEHPGALTVGMRDNFMSRVAFVVSATLQNAWLYDVAQDEIARTRLLQDVAEAGTSALGPAAVAEGMLEAVRRHLGLQAGDVRLLSPDREIIMLLASVGWSEETRERIRQVPVTAIGWMATQVVREGRPFTHEDEEEPTPERADLLRESGVLDSSYIALPLRYRDEVLGLMSLTFQGRRPFTQQERELFEAVARIFAQSMANARLYQAEHEIAETLQESLLTLPKEVKGLEIAHSYHSATETARVGGDFYDVFELSHGAVGIVVGDISGKGLDAAVLTAFVKNAIRAQATEAGKLPADVIRLANEVFLRESAPEVFATVFFSELDRTDGRLVYTNAGHTSGVVLRASGEQRLLTATGPLFGAFENVSFANSGAFIDEGEVLFLYTDGLIEARDPEGEQFGEERMLAAIKDVRPLDADTVCRAALDSVMAFTGGRLSDDLATLVIRRMPESG
jgi:serine phosphatase RsbU (regulator of sigma subunit)